MGLDNFLDLLEDVKSMSKEELTDLSYAINDRRGYLRSKDLQGFRVGDKVSWIHGRGIDKTEYVGEVEKINQKTIGVKEEGRPWAKWRCSPTLLTKLRKVK